MIRFILTTAIALLPLSALANDLPHRYQPDFCEFKIDLPSETYESKRCNPDNRKDCVIQQSFTQVFDLDATVNIRMTCVKSSETAYKAYTEETAKAVLRALTTRSTVSSFNTSFRDEGEYKQGGVVGEGQTGNKPNLYLGQLWIGKGSIMTVEAELIGDVHEPADTLFRDILRSVSYSPISDQDIENDKAEDKESDEDNEAAGEEDGADTSEGEE